MEPRFTNKKEQSLHDGEREGNRGGVGKGVGERVGRNSLVLRRCKAGANSELALGDRAEQIYRRYCK